MFTNNLCLSKNQNILIVLITILFLSNCNNNSTPKIEEGTVHINGIDTYYKIMGKGKPIFILHGGPDYDSHLTMLNLKDLANDYQLIFYDQRATGKTNGDADTASHTIDNFVEDLEQLRQHFKKDKIGIIGGSWGTLLGMNYAMKYPDNVEKLALLSCLGIKYDFFDKYQETVQEHRTKKDSLLIEEIYKSKEFEQRLPEAIENFWRVYFKAYFYNPDLVTNLNITARDTSFKPIVGRYDKLYEYFTYYDLKDELHKITCPTIIINGDYDNTPLHYVKPINETIPNSELVVIENAGHWLWAEAPEKLLPILKNFFKD